MGVNGSGLKINFSRSSLFYFAGEQVQGDVTFQNSEEKITLDGIYLECVGEMGYSIDKREEIRDSNGNLKIENHTEDITMPFMNIRIPIAQPQYGQREIILYRGQHSWPFEFVLPQYLPPALAPASKSRPFVKYYARVLLNKPGYKPNTQETCSLTVFPRVNILYAPGGQQPVAFHNQNRKKLSLQGYLFRGGVVPGDKLSLHIDIQNPKQVVIKKIEAALIQHRQVGRNHDTATIFRLDLPGLIEFFSSSLQRTFELPVPAIPLLPTYTYLLQSAGTPHGVDIHYNLLLDVKARGLFTDFKVSIPVVVGTEPMSADQQQQQQLPSLPPVNVPFEMPVASAPVMEPEEPPPSYDSLVTTEKI